MLYSVALAIIGAFIGISQSAGIGGGPIINICLMVFIGYESKGAMAMTYIFLMGGSLASVIQNATKRKKNGSLMMDYNMILLNMPMASSGTIFGAMLNKYLSEFAVTCIFVVLLTYLTYVSYAKYKEFTLSQAVNSQLADSMLNKQMEFEVKVTNLHPILAETIERNRSVFQKDKLKIVLYVVLYTVGILLMRGGKSYSSWVGLQPCGIGFWMCNFLHLALSYLISKSIAIEQFKTEYQQKKLGLEIPESQLMTQTKMRSFMVYGFVAGVIGAAVGLGGAIILVPVWLKIGIDKDVATSSTGPLIFVSAFCSFFISAISGRYQMLEFIQYFVLSFVSVLIVRKIVDWVASRLNLKGVVYILLMITMVLSLIVLVPFQLTKYNNSPQDFMEFGELC